MDGLQTNRLVFQEEYEKFDVMSSTTECSRNIQNCLDCFYTGYYQGKERYNKRLILRTAWNSGLSIPSHGQFQSRPEPVIYDVILNGSAYCLGRKVVNMNPRNI